MNEITRHAITLAVVDYFIIAVILFSTLISFFRGFLAEAMSLLIWVLAAVVAFKFTASLSNMLSGVIHTPSARYIASFILLFVLILIFGSIVNHFLAAFIKSTGLSGPNRLLGMIFGFGRGILLIAIFILFAEMTSVVRDPWWQASVFIPYFKGIVNWLHQFIPSHFNNVGHYFANSRGNTQ